MVHAVRRELALWAELVGIAVVAVTQPVLDSVGNAPEQFVFRGASSADIVIVALLVTLGPATVVWLPGVLVRRWSPRAGSAVHLVAVVTGLYWGALQLLHLLGLGGPGKAVVALVLAAGGVLLFARVDGVRLWAQVMSAFAVVFLAFFLFGSPAGELVFADPPEVVALDAVVDSAVDDGTAEGPEQEQFPDIVMIVLDELPTSLLLDESGSIDDRRYPAMAEFADDATWYRSYTTVSSQTVKALPSILSGQLPVAGDLGVWTQRPDTLFRLLGGTYHLTVSEALTRFCPVDWCGSGPVAPPPPEAVDAAGGRTDPSPTPPDDRVAPDFRRGGLSALIGDVVDVWRAQVRLDRDDAPVLSGFEETAVAPPPTSPTTTPPTSSTASPTIEAVEVDDDEESAIEQEVADDFLGFGNDLVGQLPRLDAFRSALTPSDDPTLYFLHVVLPHQPFIFTENGEIYSGPSVAVDRRGEWDATIDAERMSMQMQFTDGLVGEILDQARNAGIYDDAMVIVMADHGASIATGTEYRWYDGTNAADLMVTPLLIKAPGQVTGVNSDAPLQAVDLLPTIAEWLGVDVPWPTDGRPLSELAADVDPDCSDEVLDFVRFGKNRVADPDHVERFEFCPAEVVAAGLQPTLTDVLPTDDWATAPLARRTPYADLLGVPWAELGATGPTGRFTLDDAGRAVGGADPPLGVIRGALEVVAGAEWVAVGIDGRVAGISPVYAPADDLDGPRDRFAIPVPSELLSTEGYDIRVAVLDGAGDAVAALEVTPG